MNLVPYKKFNIGLFHLELPKKVNGVYTCDIRYTDTPLNIQSPPLDLVDDSTKLQFNLCKKGQFLTVFENIEDTVVQTIFDSSSSFFNGKQFTKEYIQKSLEKIVRLNSDTGIVDVSGIKVSDKLKVYNKFRLPVKEDKDLKNVTCILNVKCVKFIKNKITIEILVTHCKLNGKYSESDLDTCILNENAVQEHPKVLDPSPELEHGFFD